MKTQRTQNKWSSTEQAPEVTGHKSSGAEPNKENEKEDRARLPAQVPSSRVLRNPGGNDKQERMDAVSGPTDGNIEQTTRGQDNKTDN